MLKLLTTLALVGALFSPSVLSAPEYQLENKLMELSARILALGHYSRSDFTEAHAEQYIQELIVYLDSEKRFVSSGQRQRLDAVYASKLSEAVRVGDFSVMVSVFDAVRNAVGEGVKEYEQQAEAIIADDFLTPFRIRMPPMPVGASSLAEDVYRHNYVKAQIGARMVRDGLAFQESQKAVSTWYKDYLLNLNTPLSESYLRTLLLDTIFLSYDPHSRYFAADEAKQAMAGDAGLEYGFGISLDFDGTFPFIVKVAASSPAQIGGLSAGDRILSVRDESEAVIDLDGVASSEFSALISQLALESGVITFEIEREGRRWSVPLQKQIIESNDDGYTLSHYRSLFDSDLNTPLPVLRFDSFYQGLTEKLLKDPEFTGAEAMIIDLRNNTGGNLGEAISFMSTFLDGGEVLRLRTSKTEESFPDNMPESLSMPLILLVSASSASAAELVAATFQDRQRAVVMGEKTYGKGSVQRYIDLSQPEFKMPDELADVVGGVKVTVAEFLSAKGRALQGVGMIPDVMTADFGSREAQFANALQFSGSSAYFAQDHTKNPLVGIIDGYAKTNPTYNFYLSKVKKECFNSMMDLEDWGRFMSRQRQAVLVWANHIRAIQNKTPVNGVDSLEDAQQAFDIEMDLALLSLASYLGR